MMGRSKRNRKYHWGSQRMCQREERGTEKNREGTRRGEIFGWEEGRGYAKVRKGGHKRVEKGREGGGEIFREGEGGTEGYMFAE